MVRPDIPIGPWLELSHETSCISSTSWRISWTTCLRKSATGWNKCECWMTHSSVGSSGLGVSTMYPTTVSTVGAPARRIAACIGCIGFGGGPKLVFAASQTCVALCRVKWGGPQQHCVHRTTLPRLFQYPSQSFGHVGNNRTSLPAIRTDRATDQTGATTTSHLHLDRWSHTLLYNMTSRSCRDNSKSTRSSWMRRTVA